MTLEGTPSALLVTFEAKHQQLQSQVRNLEAETDAFISTAKASGQPSLKHEFLASSKVLGALTNFFRRCQHNPPSDSDVYFSQLRALASELADFERTQLELQEKLSPSASEERQLLGASEDLVERWTRTFEDVKSLLEQVQALRTELHAKPSRSVKTPVQLLDIQTKGSDCECGVLYLSYLCQRKFKQLQHRTSKLQASSELLAAIQASLSDSSTLRRKIENIIGTEEVYEETVNVDAVEEMMVAAENRPAPVYYPHDEEPYFPTDEERIRDFDLNGSSSEEEKSSGPKLGTGSGTNESLDRMVEQINEGRTEAETVPRVMSDSGESQGAPAPLTPEIKDEPVEIHSETKMHPQMSLPRKKLKSRRDLTKLGSVEMESTSAQDAPRQSAVLSPRATTLRQPAGQVKLSPLGEEKTLTTSIENTTDSELRSKTESVSEDPRISSETETLVRPTHVKANSLSNHEAESESVPQKLLKVKSLSNVLKIWSEEPVDFELERRSAIALISPRPSTEVKQTEMKPKLGFESYIQTTSPYVTLSTPVEELTQEQAEELEQSVPVSEAGESAEVVQPRSPPNSLGYRREGTWMDSLVLPAVPEEGFIEEGRKESSPKDSESIYQHTQPEQLQRPQTMELEEGESAGFDSFSAIPRSQTIMESPNSSEFKKPVIHIMPPNSASEPTSAKSWPRTIGNVNRNPIFKAMQTLARIQGLSAGHKETKTTVEDLKNTISAESDTMRELQADFKDLASSSRPLSFRLHTAEPKSALKVGRSGTQSSDGEMGRTMTNESKASNWLEEEKKSGEWSAEYRKSSSGKRLQKALDDSNEESKRLSESIIERVASEGALDAQVDSRSSGSQQHHSEGRSADSRLSARASDVSKRLESSPEILSRDPGRRYSPTSYVPSGITVEGRTGSFTPYETFAIFGESLREGAVNSLPRTLVQHRLETRYIEEGGWPEWVSSLRNCESEDMAYATVVLCAVQETADCLPLTQARRFVQLVQDCDDLVKVVEVDHAVDLLTYHEATFSEEFEKIVTTGGQMYWVDTLDLIYGRLPKRLGTHLIQAMKPADIDMADYVTFLTCHRMYQQHLDGMQTFRQLDADTSGKLDALEFGRGLQNLLEVWAPEEDFKQAFQSLYNRWSGLVSKAQFSKQVNFTRYLQHTNSDLCTIAKYDFLQCYLAACRRLVREALLALRAWYETDTQVLIMQESDIRKLAMMALDSEDVDEEVAGWERQVERLGFEMTVMEARQAFVDALCR